MDDLQLVVVEGPDQGLVVSLAGKDTLLIGRSRANDVRLTDPYVSRVHCTLDLRRGCPRIVDFQSAGGTFVNEEQVTERELQPNDVIRLGGTRFQLALASIEPSTLVKTPSSGASLSSLQRELVRLVGSNLAHYEVGPVLAQGRSGLVFHAHDVKDDRTVALKVLFPAMTEDEESRTRFVRAMKTVLPLRHPNLVTVYNAGKTGQFCWLAMEFLEGESLTQTVQRVGTVGMLDWRQALHVGVWIARALAFAHDRRILHRNVTPMNVLVRTGFKSAKLGDLMLAKALEGELAKDVTKTGHVVGDLAYLAPERTYGTGEIDERSDVYGLGATLYALLTGRPPCARDTLDETIRSIRQDVPVPLKKYQLAVPDSFEGAVLRMLAKRPEDRPPNGGEALREVKKVARYQGVTLN